MFSRNRDEHHESGTVRRNRPDRSQRPRCVFFKGTSTIGNPMDGVSTYLALTFGTLLSSQGTVASFVLTLSGFPPGFPSVLRFRLYQILFRSDFLGAFQVPALAFPFPAVPTLSDPFGPDSQSAGVVFAAVGPFRRSKP